MSDCEHNCYTGSLGSRGDYQYPTVTICTRCGIETDEIKAVTVSAQSRHEKARMLIEELSYEYHHTGLLTDHANPNDKTGWNIHEIETCNDVLCREAVEFLK